MEEKQNDDDIIIIWEAPKIIPPEFRLYYDDAGKVICYTCDKLEGNYIVIDSKTYAEGRPDVRVINGKLSMALTGAIVSKLIPNKDEGQLCAIEDISILVDKSYKGKKIKWKLTTYELR